jgi:hypothetical protein
MRARLRSTAPCRSVTLRVSNDISPAYYRPHSQIVNWKLAGINGQEARILLGLTARGSCEVWYDGCGLACGGLRREAKRR